ncbi:conserved hypothetical protein [Ricinus communis]|uniref:Uncharacterized protein n=1 Tax=Ricinus communis TaxID=3988 RepID=B9RND5_RICCO|nr:conserved hypothetical protein [Ricinus communis]
MTEDTPSTEQHHLKLQSLVHILVPPEPRPRGQNKMGVTGSVRVTPMEWYLFYSAKY